MKKIRIIFLVGLIVLSCTSEEKQSDRLYLYQDEETKDLAIIYGNDILSILNYSNENYKAFFYPVNTIEGTRITRGWPIDPYPFEPLDHPHQKGMWFNFGDVNGIDFWNNSDSIKAEDKHKYGRIYTDSLIIDSLTENSGSFILFTTWIAETGEILLKEKAKFKISVHVDYWKLERLTELTAQREVTFSDNKEGLFAIRMAREFQSDLDKKEWILDEKLKSSAERLINNTGKSGFYFGSNGTEGKDTWGTANAWVCLNGIRENDSISILIMDHPDNFTHPPHWHARDYGLFSVDNFGRKAFQGELDALSLMLEKDESVILHHSIIVKNGGFLNTKKAKDLYEHFK